MNIQLHVCGITTRRFILLSKVSDESQVRSMGREYQSEIKCLHSTVEWVKAVDLSAEKAAFDGLHRRSVVVVASGGSIAAAQLFAQLHTQVTGHVALVMTPLEFAAETYAIDSAAVFISSGGSNSDILRAWESAAARGVLDVGVLCANSTSKLAELVREARVAASVMFDLPSGRDGFLATNSLVAFIGIILRLYGIALPALPERLQGLATKELLARKTLIVLYAGWLKPVAIDLESRFTEAALGCVQLADFRNFAHGRHHWLAKRGSDTAVLALVTPTYAALARDTLAQIPQQIPVERWEFDEDTPRIALLGLQRSLELAGLAAVTLGYDPGRPGVPTFGEHIYELKTAPEPRPLTRDEIAIERKARVTGVFTERGALREALTRFEDSLHHMEISGVVLDYDGTLVATNRRFDDVDASVAAELNRLLCLGLLVGVATGRGKSVHQKLRVAIAQAHWAHCVVGYYNGGLIRSIAEPCTGMGEGDLDPAISAAHATLRGAPELRAATLEVRPLQITVTGTEYGELGLWKKVRGALERSQLSGFKVVHSSHSVDVIPMHVSKAAFVEHMAARAGVAERTFLKIGDRGCWPGNDSEMLAMSGGLSVDQVSTDLHSCWNLTPPGAIGPRGTLYYLKHIDQGRNWNSPKG